MQPHHKLTHKYQWIFSARLFEVYHDKNTYSCKETEHLTLSISTEIKNQEYHPPSDVHTIHVYQNKITIHVNSQLTTINKPNRTSFIEYCKNLQLWKKYLLQHIFLEYPDSLDTCIQEVTPISIATYSTKSRKQSGGGWVITSSTGKIVAHGANPDLGSMENMHSHRSEAYAILSVLVFLFEYSNYFSLPLNNKCTIYCDNKEIVNKVQQLTKTKNEFQPYKKISEHEAIIAIQHYLPKRIHVIHIYSHQDAIKEKTNLTFPEKLNDLADNIAGTYARSPINNHIPMTPLAVYINKQYIPNNYQYHLRRISFQQDANKYLKRTYN